MKLEFRSSGACCTLLMWWHMFPLDVFFFSPWTLSPCPTTILGVKNWNNRLEAQEFAL